MEVRSVPPLPSSGTVTLTVPQLADYFPLDEPIYLRLTDALEDRREIATVGKLVRNYLRSMKFE